MKYRDGQEVRLGDKITVPVVGGHSLARVIVLGDSMEHLEVDTEYLALIVDMNVLKSFQVVAEWLVANPYLDEPDLLPMQNYMLVSVDENIEMLARAND